MIRSIFNTAPLAQANNYGSRIYCKNARSSRNYQYQLPCLSGLTEITDITATLLVTTTQRVQQRRKIGDLLNRTANGATPVKSSQCRAATRYFSGASSDGSGEYPNRVIGTATTSYRTSPTAEKHSRDHAEDFVSSWLSDGSKGNMSPVSMLPLHPFKFSRPSMGESAG